MSSKLHTFTSTGNKIMRQGELLSSWNKGIPKPQSLQVALTEICNLKCVFCSVANRTHKYVWDYDKLLQATKNFIDLGIKTIEISGGGEPTLYPHINEYIMFLKKHNIQIGLITNGININSTISKHLLNDISWIRISANVLDYKDKIDIPEDYTGTLGFSYCWTEGISSVEQLRKIQDIAKSNNVKYIRLVPNCLATTEEQIVNNERLSKLAATIGEPLFFQAKVFDTPDNCYWGYMKPFLYPDEYIYPCSSSILNDAADKQFNPIYRWYHYEDTKKIYSEKIKSAINTKNCNHCVFTEQNKMMEYALNPQTHENFI